MLIVAATYICLVRRKTCQRIKGGATFMKMCSFRGHDADQARCPSGHSAREGERGL